MTLSRDRAYVDYSGSPNGGFTCSFFARLVPPASHQIQKHWQIEVLERAASVLIAVMRRVAAEVD
jgi:hypothetical protein